MDNVGSINQLLDLRKAQTPLGLKNLMTREAEGRYKQKERSQQSEKEGAEFSFSIITMTPKGDYLSVK